MWAKLTPLALPATLAIMLVLPISQGRWGRGPIEGVDAGMAADLAVRFGAQGRSKAT